MDRQSLLVRLKAWDDTGVPEVGHAIELLESSQEEAVSNSEIGDVWDWVSKALDHQYSDDDDHDAWKLESELASAYQRD